MAKKQKKKGNPDRMDLGMEALEQDLKKSDPFGCKKGNSKKPSFGGIKLGRVW